MFTQSCTYGLFSIKQNTFNAETSGGGYLPKPMRDLAVTALRLNNLVLHILGYISRLSPISGCIRIGIGAGIMIITAAIGNPNAHSGNIVGRWYNEAMFIGIAQIFRGSIEAFIPSSFIINGILDIIGTGVNCMKRINISLATTHARAQGEQLYLHDEPNYPCPLCPLYLV